MMHAPMRHQGVRSALSVNSFTPCPKDDGFHCKQVIPQARAIYYIASYAETSEIFILNVAAEQTQVPLVLTPPLSYKKTELTVCPCQLSDSLLTMGLQVNRKEFQSHNLKVCKKY